MGRLDYQRAAGNAGVIRGSRIIRPRIRAVFVLPLADGNALHLCGQSCLRRTNQRRAGIVLEHIGVRCDIGEPRIFRIFDQRKRDIRGDIDGVFCLRIVIADIAQIGQHAGSRRGQLVFTDRQNAARHRFPGRKRRFRARAVLALPCDGQSGRAERNAGLVEKNDRRQLEIAGVPARRIGVRQDIWVFHLRFRKVGCDIGGQLPLIGDVHECLLR